MNYLTKLKSCSSQKDFATLLGYPHKTFTQILFSQSIDKRYSAFQIPKKNKEMRNILAPDKNLKNLQFKLALLLTRCYEELEVKRLTSSSHIECISSHGFRKKFTIDIPVSKNNRKKLLTKNIKLGIYSNARRHINKKHMVNLDIKNFFESITFPRIVGFFIKNNDFALDYEVATLIAQIATYRENTLQNGYLPQGSPCSPIISNLIANILDGKMLHLAKKHKLTYTRYADDLTFSTNMNQLPSEIAILNNNVWEIGLTLESTIKSCNFKINSSKTRVTNREARQEVTGLTVNKKVNINKNYYKYTRTMVNSYCSKGEFRKSKFHMEPEKNTSASLNGILDFITSIKKHGHTAPEGKTRDFSELESIEKLYVKFLFHYYFIFPETMTVIGEGYTDPEHLKLAYKQLHKSSAAKIKFSALQHTKKFSKIMGYSGGTGLLNKFITNYMTIYKSTTRSPHPCVILVDGDEAGNGVINCGRKIQNFQMINLKSSMNGLPILDFYHAASNLYFLKLPTGKAVEDLYHPSVLDTKLDSKTFNPSNKTFDLKKFYGKKDLIDHVIIPNKASIDFSGFNDIFNTLLHIQTHHLLLSYL